jgi:biotin carboxylase
VPTVPSVTQRTFRRLAVVNRGEPAMRLINAVRELNEERADDPIRVIALYTEPERSAMFVRHADEAYSLGPTMRVDADGRRTGAYLDYANLERALRAVRADAVWPGWGFVAEHPAFSDLCEAMGIVFVGPSGDVMRALGDKIQSKLLAEKAGVPVAAWSNGPVESIEEAREHAERIGFPLMIKAAAAASAGSPPRTSWRTRSTPAAARPRTRSATAPCSWRRWSATRTTSRCS